MVGVPWVYIMDTSRRTDYLLSLGVTVVAGALALAVAALGAWTVAAALATLTLALAATTGYARLLWERERRVTGSSASRAIKVRPAR